MSKTPADRAHSVRDFLGKFDLSASEREEIRMFQRRARRVTQDIRDAIFNGTGRYPDPVEQTIVQARVEKELRAQRAADYERWNAGGRR